MDENYLKDLINKYINGTATDGERNELLDWYRNAEDEFMLPYENYEEEEAAKERMLNGLMQRINSQQVKSVNKLWYLKIAAAAILLISTCYILYREWPAKHAETAAVVMNTVTTQRGERKVITLTDGSVIYLNAGSTLSYPVEFNGATREIAFKGEAFFEIAKDKKHPFIVHTGKTSTRVLGTSFNITDRDDQPEMTVALITGKVAFTDGSSQTSLSPGQLVAYTRLTGKLKVKRIPDTQAVTNRRDGLYEYHNVKVAAIAEDLNMNFGVSITVSGKVRNCEFFGRIKQGESLQTFLQKLAIVENARLVKSDNGYLIKGGGCN